MIPEEDQWPYHAVANVILAHSLIRSFPAVDPNRIGISGVSRGGYLTCIAAGADSRFRFAAPVYGCGFLVENSAWSELLAQLAPDQALRWLQHWDASTRKASAALPDATRVFYFNIVDERGLVVSSEHAIIGE